MAGLLVDETGETETTRATIKMEESRKIEKPRSRLRNSDCWWG
jgi:hypothetical protein